MDVCIVLGGKGSVWRSSAVSQEGRWTDGGDQGILVGDEGFLLLIKVCCWWSRYLVGGQGILVGDKCA